ncbi:MAG: YfaZ family outer membrane protein [Geminicoccaceae bacterium]
MNMIRIIGLLSAAFLTMGSGGISKVTNDEPPATPEPAYIEIEPAEAVPASGSDPEIATAASHTPAARSPVSPATSAASSDHGAAIEVSLSNDYIQARYYTGGGILGFDNAQGHVGVYISDNRDLIGNIGLMTVPVPLLTEDLTLSAGARGYLGLLSSPNDDAFGVAPGVEVRYQLPFAHPMYASGNIFYAPDVLTFGDAEDLIDLDLRYEAQLIPSAIGFIGYREFRFDSDEGGDKEAANEIQVGVRFYL